MLFHFMLITQGKVALELEMATPLQYSHLGNPTDRGAWQAISIGSQELDTTEHKLCPMEGSIY